MIDPGGEVVRTSRGGGGGGALSTHIFECYEGHLVGTPEMNSTHREVSIDVLQP